MLTSNATHERRFGTPCGRRRIHHGRKAHDSRSARRHSPRRRRSSAGGPEHTASDPTAARAGKRRVGDRRARVRVGARAGSRPLRVPARRRRRLQLTGTRPRERQLLDEQHACDRPQDVPERQLLLARPLRHRRRVGLAVVAGSAVQEVVDRGRVAPVAGRRCESVVRP